MIPPIQLHTLRFQALARQGVVWLELHVVQGGAPSTLLDLVARSRSGDEIQLNVSALIDSLHQGDPSAMTGDASDLFGLLFGVPEGLHVYVLSNGHLGLIGKAQSVADRAATTSDLGWSGFKTNVTLSAAEVEHVADRWVDLDELSRLGVLSNPETPAPVLHVAALSSTLAEAHLIARHTATGPDTLITLVQRSGAEIGVEVAHHSNATPGLLHQLVGLVPALSGRLSDTTHLCSAIARHPRTTAETLKLLYDEHYLHSPQMVAGHPHTPAMLLHPLSRSPERAIRLNVAHNRSAPASVLHSLAVDKNADVRRGAEMSLGLAVKVTLKPPTTSHQA